MGGVCVPLLNADVSVQKSHIHSRPHPLTLRIPACSKLAGRPEHANIFGRYCFSILENIGKLARKGTCGWQHQCGFLSCLCVL